MAHGPPGGDGPVSTLPKERIDRWVAPIRRFMRIEATAGVVLLACTAIALYLANSEWAPDFHALLRHWCRELLLPSAREGDT